MVAGRNGSSPTIEQYETGNFPRLGCERDLIIAAGVNVTAICCPRTGFSDGRPVLACAGAGRARLSPHATHLLRTRLTCQEGGDRKWRKRAQAFGPSMRDRSDAYAMPFSARGLPAVCPRM